MSRTLRDVIVIDEDKCDGCGACVPACAEGALRIIEGKARLVNEVYCDGFGACLGTCPTGALRVERREAGEFDEDAAREHVDRSEVAGTCPSGETYPSCPATATAGTGAGQQRRSGLQNWPIQLGLVSPTAAFLQDADLLLAADCTGYAYEGFRDLASGRVVLVACPKLDDKASRLSKLTAILSQSSVTRITVLRMDVPCCAGLVRLAFEAVRQSGKDIPVDVVVAELDGSFETV